MAVVAVVGKAAGGMAAVPLGTPLFWGAAAAEGVLALACLAIPGAIAMLLRRRGGTPFAWLAGLLAAFLAAAGLAHLLALGVLWRPLPGALVAAKLLAATLAAATAVALWRFLPLVLALPNIGRLEAINTALSDEIVMRRAREARLGEVNDTLEEGREMLERICDGLRETAADARAMAERRAEHLATMSHEIRTPLHGIIGMLAMLRERVEEEGSAALVARAGDSADGLLRLLDQTLDQSRAEARGEVAAPALAPFSPAEIIEQVAGLFGATAEAKGLALEVAIAPEAAGEAHGDAVGLRQILSNLVGNAVKFTEAGRIAIRARRDEGAGRGLLVLEVADTGPGIAPERQATLFDRYARGDGGADSEAGGEAGDAAVGAGLGLAICRDLVAALGGRIALSGEPGQGTTVTVTLPCPALPAPSAGDAADHGRAALAGRRVLVVDDNETNRLIVRHALGAAQVTLEEAATGHQALATLATRPVDAVLLDLSLPDLGGAEVAAMIRHGDHGRADLPIVVVSAHARGGESLSLLALGITGFLAKPFRPAALIESLVTALADRPPVAGPEASALPPGACAGECCAASADAPAGEPVATPAPPCRAAGGAGE